MSAVPLALLGAVATAYGFLEGERHHPSLELGGAFVIAPLAIIAVLLGRSSLLRGGPEMGTGAPTAFDVRDRRDVVVTGVALASVGAALIHFAVIEQHLDEFWMYGTFFIVLAVFELGWALIVTTAPSRLMYTVGAIVNASTIVAYVITRTVGVLVGPSATETEKIGFGDLVSTAFELLIVVGCVVLLVRPWGRARVRTATSEAWIGTLAIGVTVSTILALFSTVSGPPFVSPAG